MTNEITGPLVDALKPNLKDSPQASALCLVQIDMDWDWVPFMYWTSCELGKGKH